MFSKIIINKIVNITYKPHQVQDCENIIREKLRKSCPGIEHCRTP